MLANCPSSLLETKCLHYHIQRYVLSGLGVLSSSQTITCPDSFAKSADCLAHRLWICSSKGRAEEQIFGRLVVLCRKPGASSDKDALLNAQVEDFLFYLGNAALACVRVEIVVDPEPLLRRERKRENSKVSSDHKQE